VVRQQEPAVAPRELQPAAHWPWAVERARPGAGRCPAVGNPLPARTLHRADSPPGVGTLRLADTRPAEGTPLAVGILRVTGIPQVPRILPVADSQLRMATAAVRQPAPTGPARWTVRAVRPLQESPSPTRAFEPFL